MSYYWFNRQEILEKAKERYPKEKAAEYYLKNKEGVKEKSRERYKNLSNFLGNEVPKENMHYTCIACITIDSVMRMDKKTIHRLEECKYRIEKRQMSRFTTAKLKSDSESDSETESKSDNKLMAKLESNSDSE